MKIVNQINFFTIVNLLVAVGVVVIVVVGTEKLKIKSNQQMSAYSYQKRSLVVVVISPGVEVVKGRFGSFGTLASQVTESDTVHQLNSTSNHNEGAQLRGIGSPLKQTKYRVQSLGFGR